MTEHTGRLPVKPLPEEVWYLRVMWDGPKPKQTKGGGLFRSKADALARRRNLYQRWPDQLRRATLHRATVEWNEYVDWMDPDLKL